MGRGALQVTVTANNRDVHLIVAHLKSKLLTFPGGFQPADEDQRARFASYALYRRASEATTLRTHLDGLLQGGGRTMAAVLPAPRSRRLALPVPTEAMATACSTLRRASSPQSDASRACSGASPVAVLPYLQQRAGA